MMRASKSCSTVLILVMACFRRLRCASDDQSGAWPGRTRGRATPVWRRMRKAFMMSGVVPNGMVSVRECQASFQV
eukprot:4745214-Alexandrium_andersonii.AAC.1